MLARHLPLLKTVFLHGHLGAGKTCLVRALLRELGHTGPVKSPTYTLMEPYVVSTISVYHFDFYRFTSPEEFLEAGLDEYFEMGGSCWVEWSEKAQPYLPLPDLEIFLDITGCSRNARLTGLSETGKKCIEMLKETI